MSLDQKKIEEGLKRLERRKKKEAEEKVLKEMEEVRQVEEQKTLNLISRKEEEENNAKIRQENPGDVCPVCNTHVVDARYIVIVPRPVVTVACGKCGNIYAPQSKLRVTQQILQDMIDGNVNMIVPPPAPNIV